MTSPMTPRETMGDELLVEWLRDEARSQAARLTPRTGSAAREEDDPSPRFTPEQMHTWKAADTIEQQRRRIAELEAALGGYKRVYRWFRKYPEFKPNPDCAEFYIADIEAMRADYDAAPIPPVEARSALQEKRHGD
jgi:hypothetical protein